ncbi:hypothetical protein [Vannielia litorea]|uniref:Uncharacterized protein n=1 Tax=Vannielia litorea TaxID=1217970 RepID=A0A1N6E8T3_9RHOB|nr:hypothetical protein [Vannielia litorea]SIN79422.1 hypothetical protein SAMN05444002_0464 [Vannielia litorea]
MSRPESFPPALPTQPAALADALGAIRAQMAVLKTCEAALRRALVEARPNGPVTGAAFTVTLHHGTRRRLDPTRLPAYIRDDPAFWRESRSTTLVTTPRASAETPEDDDFEVIERFG